jgi:hypothetical protein
MKIEYRNQDVDYVTSCTNGWLKRAVVMGASSKVGGRQSGMTAPKVMSEKASRIETKIAFKALWGVGFEFLTNVIYKDSTQTSRLASQASARHPDMARPSRRQVRHASTILSGFGLPEKGAAEGLGKDLEIVRSTGSIRNINTVRIRFSESVVVIEHHIRRG